MPTDIMITWQEIWSKILNSKVYFEFFFLNESNYPRAPLFFCIKFVSNFQPNNHQICRHLITKGFSFKSIFDIFFVGSKWKNCKKTSSPAWRHFWLLLAAKRCISWKFQFFLLSLNIIKSNKKNMGIWHFYRCLVIF